MIFQPPICQRRNFTRRSTYWRVAASRPESGGRIAVLKTEVCPSFRSNAMARGSLILAASTILRYWRLAAEIGRNSGSRGGATAGFTGRMSAESIIADQTLRAERDV